MYQGRLAEIADTIGVSRFRGDRERFPPRGREISARERALNPFGHASIISLWRALTLAREQASYSRWNRRSCVSISCLKQCATMKQVSRVDIAQLAPLKYSRYINVAPTRCHFLDATPTFVQTRIFHVDRVLAATYLRQPAPLLFLDLSPLRSIIPPLRSAPFFSFPSFLSSPLETPPPARRHLSDAPKSPGLSLTNDRARY